MEELLKQVLSRIEAMDRRLEGVDTRLEAVDIKIDRVENKVDLLQQGLDSHHIENIEADNRLLETIHTTNDRLDYQREKISKTEEEIYLLKQKH
jgi:hypothetical protein